MVSNFGASWDDQNLKNRPKSPLRGLTSGGSPPPPPVAGPSNARGACTFERRSHPKGKVVAIPLGVVRIDMSLFHKMLSSFRNGGALRVCGASEPGTGCAPPQHTQGAHTLRAQAIPITWAAWRRCAKSYGLRHVVVHHSQCGSLPESYPVA